ncbi:c-type cytochrome [Jannaschia seohaensis]|uniref:Cbb3-type cytochrome c oxidase subunit III n=1 Tax=Jannaschia seohaensis TaxID=475081 RepID=A0A2Y9B3T8_9RHOB|nr:c-type cytochrome [Jannaschia seohaensis]PWJ13339.1 cbb3-type cytochrome c oxidase subunit III [Jannaschia seohaensis]SSA50665.1 Cytochrome C oxidase, cbb3-type, subunit III [Jannaschia seohaensis]
MRIALLALLLPFAAAAQEARVVEGEALFLRYCATCHGEDARGGGPMQSVLSVAVPDLTALAGEGGFPHFGVIAKIDGRDPVISHGGVMPVWGDFFDMGQGAFVRTEAGQPIVTTPPVAALVAWLEAVQE